MTFWMADDVFSDSGITPDFRLQGGSRLWSDSRLQTPDFGVTTDSRLQSDSRPQTPE